MRSCGRRFLLATAFAGLCAADARPPDDVPWPEPAPELVEAAAAWGVHLVAPGAEPSESAQPADTLHLLVTLEEPARTAQWLVRLRRSTDGPVEVTMADTVLYGLDGRELRFAALPVRLDVLAIGPVSSGDPATPPVRTVPIVLNAVFAGERLDHAARLMARIGEARRAGRLGEEEWFTVHRRRPARPEHGARERFVVEAALSDAEERAFAATVPALEEFVRVVVSTPGLQDIFFAVVDRPPWWTILTRGGRVDTEFRFLAGGIRTIDEPPPEFAGAGPCHEVPFRLNVQGRPALACAMLLVEPHPPLDLTGGIIAVAGSSPTRPGVRVVVRVLAVRPGATAVPTD